ncbi:MAG: hypothetical protein ACKVS7_13345 [Gemmatimonadaceae bacterium]
MPHLRSRFARAVAFAALALPSCSQGDEPDDVLWSLAAASVADAATGRRTWEAVAVDAVGPAERAIAKTLALSLVARPGGRAVPCPATATRDGVPDVTMFSALDRLSDRRATASLAFVCDYHDGRRARANSQTFIVDLARGWRGWRVAKWHEAKQE